MTDIPGISPQEQLLVGLSRLGQALRISSYRNTGPYRLSPLQADIVLLLARDPRPRRQSEITEALASTAPTVSDALRALTNKELVIRHRDATDARAAAVTLTDQGRAETERLAQVPAPLQEALDALSAGELAGMVQGVSTMIQVLQAHKAIPVSRMCVTCCFFRPNSHPAAERPHHCAFIDEAFSDVEMRIDCPDHETLPDPGGE